ncbi:MAG: carbon starvation protein A [Deltaproteobacteria bacterium HGW-Deltaproteobacteria-6]|nr:MAG: carbon starvation protein A [Deltaproteobacteria bacterium HGW-Deltaproteobacteria-6]
MNVAILLIISAVLFLLAYRFYGRFIARLFGEDDKKPTPACALQDDCDYVPTKPIVLFGHHFASIAGGGPIIGPTVALLFGFLPLWLWAILGTIFIGAVHDMTVLFASVREKGKSVAEIAKESLGNTGFFLFVSFAILMLLLLTSAFLGLTATALTSTISLDILRLDHSQTVVRTIMVGGVEKAQIGGIASTSVIFITCCAPVIGWLVYKKNINVYLAAAIAIVVCITSIFVGINFPITFEPSTWMIILCVYTLLAAGIPVWIILQPRDFTNSFLLYLGAAALFIGGIVAGFKGVTFSAPALNMAEGTSKLGPIWPFLFITVACGAISGFHSLVAGGTTSKQISKESHVKPIAYGGMLLEGLLAIGVMIAVGCGIMFSDYVNIVFPTAAGVKANPILAFAAGVGGLMDKSLGIAPIYGTIFGILLVEGFVVTTLDTAVRLNRYLLEEVWQVIFKNVPTIMNSYLFNALLCVVLMYILAYTNAFAAIWPIFGSANQLLASLALIAVSAWLAIRKKTTWFTVLPAIFMMATTLYSLVSLLINKYIPKNNVALALVDILLIVLAIGVIILAYKKWQELRNDGARAKGSVA